MSFQPDYHHIVNAARNIQPARLPLYEHIIGEGVMAQVLGCEVEPLRDGNAADVREYMRRTCAFYRRMGYDTVSFEGCITSVMPQSGCLYGHAAPAISDRDDFERYPWEEIEPAFFKRYTPFFQALREAMPEGMKAIGGCGNGIFECVQDIVGFENLCYIAADDEDLYADLFARVGETNLRIWKRFLREFGDVYCVMRFGDDLGFKSNTMLSAADIRTHIIPQYKRIIDAVHEAGKPFLLHSCGCIFSVMEDLIAAGVDAKHSNEDQIALFPVWVEKYGDRIGNFGGIDTDAVCRLDKPAMTEYIHNVIRQCEGCGGFAFSTGNSIPDYVPVDQYLHMVETVRRYRGE